MAKYNTSGIGNFYHHYPRIAAVITVSSRGRSNAMAAAWHSPISHTPPIFGVSLAPKRHTYKMILQAGEFGINFLPMEKAELIVSVGDVSGAEADKFKMFGIETEKPVRTGVPILKDAYAAYECRLLDNREYGDHIWVAGEVVASHFEEELFTPDETLDLNRVSPVLYMGADLYTTAARDNIRHIERESRRKR